MKLNMHIGVIVDSNYARKYSEGSYLYRNINWEHEIDSFSVYWSFIHWLIEKYSNDFIDHSSHDCYLKKDVLVVTTDCIDMLCEEEFFRIDGTLAQLFFDKKIDVVYNEFLAEKDK